MAVRTLLLCAAVGSAAALTAPVTRAVRPAMRRTTEVQASVFDSATAQWNAEFPYLAKFGFGPSAKAERWNGRHAMFGWVVIVATGYAQSHGLIPSPEVPLSYASWGGLSQMGFNEYISNERAIIMIAHTHFLAFSLAAAFGPKVLDPLTLANGESDEEAAGFMPAIQPGLTASAELLNGRMAMLGLVLLVLTSAFTGKDILEVVNIGLGGLLLK